MKTIAKTLGITLLTAVTALAPLSTAANAGDRYWKRQHYQQDMSRIYNYREYSDRHLNERNYVYRHGGYNDNVYRHRRNDDAIALGIIGLGAAAIIGGAIANSHHNPRVIYRDPHPPRHVSGGYEPWSRSWMRFCSNKYRSFNPSTGTYRGYDGRDHFCVVR